jgi:hypothetical protein
MDIDPVYFVLMCGYVFNLFCVGLFVFNILYEYLVDTLTNLKTIRLD